MLWSMFAQTTQFLQKAGSPTGGAAGIVMNIGPNAPISFESKYRASHHMARVYDFYKLDVASEYPCQGLESNALLITG
ncbi:hypothetical protein ACP4OV_020863 [Aristida adscensionis]